MSIDPSTVKLTRSVSAAAPAALATGALAPAVRTGERRVEIPATPSAPAVPARSDDAVVIGDDRALNQNGNWASMTHQQLYDAVHNDNDPAQGHAVAQDWATLGTDIATQSAAFAEKIRNTESGWQGAGATAARAATSKLAAWGQQAANTAHGMSQQVTAQTTAAEQAKATMPEPISFDWNKMLLTGFASGGLAGLTAAAVDAKQKSDQANEAHARAVDVMTTMEASSRDVDTRTPRFVPPPVTAKATPASMGTRAAMASRSAPVAPPNTGVPGQPGVPTTRPGALPPGAPGLGVDPAATTPGAGLVPGAPGTDPNAPGGGMPGAPGAGGGPGAATVPLSASPQGLGGPGPATGGGPSGSNPFDPKSSQPRNPGGGTTPNYVPPVGGPGGDDPKERTTKLPKPNLTAPNPDDRRKAEEAEKRLRDSLNRGRGPGPEMPDGNRPGPKMPNFGPGPEMPDGNKPGFTNPANSGPNDQDRANDVLNKIRGMGQRDLPGGGTGGPGGSPGGGPGGGVDVGKLTAQFGGGGDGGFGPTGGAGGAGAGGGAGGFGPAGGAGGAGASAGRLAAGGMTGANGAAAKAAEAEGALRGGQGAQGGQAGGMAGGAGMGGRGAGGQGEKDRKSPGYIKGEKIYQEPDRIVPAVIGETFKKKQPPK